MSGKKQALRRWLLAPLGLSLSLIATQSGFATAKSVIPDTCVSYDQFTWYAFGHPYDTVHGETPSGPFSGYSYDFTQTTNSGTYHSAALYGTIAAEHNVVPPASCS